MLSSVPLANTMTGSPDTLPDYSDIKPFLNANALSNPDSLLGEHVVALNAILNKAGKENVKEIIPLENFSPNGSGFVMRVKASTPAENVFMDGYRTRSIYPLRLPTSNSEMMKVCDKLGFGVEAKMTRKHINQMLPKEHLPSFSTFPAHEFVARTMSSLGVLPHSEFEKIKAHLPEEEARVIPWVPALDIGGRVTTNQFYDNHSRKMHHCIVVESGAPHIAKAMVQYARSKNMTLGEMMDDNVQTAFRTMVNMNSDALAYRAFQALGLTNHIIEHNDGDYRDYGVIAHTGSEKFVKPTERTITHSIRQVQQEEDENGKSDDFIVYNNAIDLTQSPMEVLFDTGLPNFKIMIPRTLSEHRQSTRETLQGHQLLGTWTNGFYSSFPAGVPHTDNYAESLLATDDHLQSAYANNVAWTNDDDCHFNRFVLAPAARDVMDSEYAAKMGWNNNWAQITMDVGMAKIAPDHGENITLDDVTIHHPGSPSNYFYNPVVSQKVKGKEICADQQIEIPDYVMVPASSEIIPQIAANYADMRKEWESQGVTVHPLSFLIQQEGNNIKVTNDTINLLRDIIDRKKTDVENGVHDVVIQTQKRAAVLQAALDKANETPCE